jgi:hypothetical protein
VQCRVDLPPDTNIPSCSVDAKALLAAISEIVKGSEFTLKKMSEQAVVVGTSAWTKVVSTGAQPPSIPDTCVSSSVIPEHILELIPLASHAVSEDEVSRPSLTRLHFSPHCVSATDELRLCRVNAFLGETSRLLPPKLFDHLPKHYLGSSWAVKGDVFILVAEEEVRAARWQAADDFPDLTAVAVNVGPILAAKMWDPALGGDLKELVKAVKAARKASPSDTVELEVAEAGAINGAPLSRMFLIKGMLPTGLAAYSHATWIPDGTGTMRRAVRGALLEKAVVAAAKTGVVQLGLTSGPVSVSGDGIMELIWPLSPDETQTNGNPHP